MFQLRGTPKQIPSNHPVLLCRSLTQFMLTLIIIHRPTLPRRQQQCRHSRVYFPRPESHQCNLVQFLPSQTFTRSLNLKGRHYSPAHISHLQGHQQSHFRLPQKDRQQCLPQFRQFKRRPMDVI